MSGECMVDICSLVEHQNWDELRRLLEQNPDYARRIVDGSNGLTLLHCLASFGSSPIELVRYAATLNPDAIVLPDRRYGDTPLHAISRNSQTSSAKLQVLLELCPAADGLLTRNHFGGTPLHSASNHNAILSALQVLVSAHDRIIKVATFQGIHAVTTLWHAYMQTIQGHMCVARILEDDWTFHENNEELPGHFRRFWEKCEYLAIEYFRRTDSCPENLDRQHVLHGLLRCNIPINLFKVALKCEPSCALAADTSGNLPLHWVLENRPFRLKEKEAVRALIESAPQAASRVNHARDMPLIIALRNKIPWDNGIDTVLSAQPMAVQHRDVATSFLPFQLAAFIGGKVAVETTYHLLSRQPDLLCS